MKLFNIYKKLKKYGIRNSLSIFFHKIFGVFYIYEINLKNFNEKILNNYSYVFKMIDKNILDRMYIEKKVPVYKIEILKDRIKNYKETLNYIVMDSNNNIMGHFCIALKNISVNPYINSSLIIEKGTTYYFDDFTIEEYRKKGVQTYSLLKRMEISKKLGYEKSIILTYNFNINAQKAIEKSGMKKIQVIYEINLFKKKIFMYGRRSKNENM